MKLKSSILMGTAVILSLAVIGIEVPSAMGAVPEVPNVAKDPTEVPPSPVGDVTIDLEAVEVLTEVVPGFKAWVWTFKDAGNASPTIPGPMIRVREGNYVTINLKNLIDNVEPHNIDLHAAMGPGGGAAVTGVLPGETKTLKFKATKQGSYIYHCAGEGMPWEHVAYGMYGLIQVDPPGGLPAGFKEFYVGQNDWYLMANSLSAEPRDFLASDVLVLDEDRALDELPNYYTFNGHTEALTTLYHPMVNQYDKVRIFFVTGGPNKGSNFHIIGQIFEKVCTGHFGDCVRNEETVYVAPGSAAVFEMSAPVPGTYLLVDHALWRVPKGAAGKLHVQAKVPATVDPISGEVTNPGSWPVWLYWPVATGTGH